MRYINILIALILFAFSCNNKKVEQLQRENDSLRNLVQQSDFTIQQYLAAFNEIQENLNTIKQKENIITVQTTGVEGDLSQDVKDQINDDILTIYSLLEQNKQKLQQLKKQLQATNTKNAQLLRTIQLYEEQLQQKDQEINQLKQKLAELNINIQVLNQQIDSIEQQVDTLKQIQQQQKQVIQQQDVQLHTAYYVVDTKTNLKDHGVIDRNGLMKKLSITGNFDKNYFVRIDTRNTTQIPVMAKRIEILTVHPNDSYELKYENNQITYLVITDTNRFWETSKFLVIMIK